MVPDVVYICNIMVTIFQYPGRHVYCVIVTLVYIDIAEYRKKKKQNKKRKTGEKRSK